MSAKSTWNAFVLSAEILDRQLIWQGDQDLYGADVAGFRFDWIIGGTPLVRSLRHSIVLTPVSDLPTANPDDQSIEEDGSATLRWDDLRIADVDEVQPDRIRVAALPTRGEWRIGNTPLSPADIVTQQHFDQGLVNYVAGLDDYGTGTYYLDFQVVDESGRLSEHASQAITVTRVNPRGIYRLDAYDAGSGDSVATAGVWQTLDVHLVAQAELPFNQTYGGYVDIKYNPNVLQLI
ncbi:MAG: hypothetical protein AAFN70_04905, partial [Planctomycetota bacterium]